eukprot:UN30788
MLLNNIEAFDSFMSEALDNSAASVSVSVLEPKSRTSSTAANYGILPEDEIIMLEEDKKDVNDSAETPTKNEITRKESQLSHVLPSRTNTTSVDKTHTFDNFTGIHSQTLNTTEEIDEIERSRFFSNESLPNLLDRNICIIKHESSGRWFIGHKFVVQHYQDEDLFSLNLVLNDPNIYGFSEPTKASEPDEKDLSWKMNICLYKHVRLSCKKIDPVSPNLCKSRELFKYMLVIIIVCIFAVQLFFDIRLVYSLLFQQNDHNSESNKPHIKADDENISDFYRYECFLLIIYTSNNSRLTIHMYIIRNFYFIGSVFINNILSTCLFLIFLVTSIYHVYLLVSVHMLFLVF